MKNITIGTLILLSLILTNSFAVDYVKAADTQHDLVTDEIRVDLSDKLGTSTSGSYAKAPVIMPFYVYKDFNSPENHYFDSGWMGDPGDLNVDLGEMANPHSGTTCIKITYSAKATQGANWAGIFWQDPLPYNWGDRPGGYNLTGAKKLVFWARGAKGSERIEEFKIGGMLGKYPDSDVTGIGPVLLNTDWSKYEIDLAGKNLSSIIGGFCWAAEKKHNLNGFVFYLDDIRYE